MLFAPPQEFEAVYYDQTAATSGLAAMAARSPLTPLQHNSVCCVLGLKMDDLSDAFKTQAATVRATDADVTFAELTYHGAIPAYDGRRILAVGEQERPTDERRATWWLAAQQMLRRMGDGLVIVPATTAATAAALPATARLVATFGAAREAVIAPRNAPAGTMITEPNDGTSANIGLLLSGLLIATLGEGYTRPTELPAPGAEPSSTDPVAMDAFRLATTAYETNRTSIRDFDAAIAVFAQATALAERLAAEERAEAKAANKSTLIGAGIIIGMAIAIKMMARG